MPLTWHIMKAGMATAVSLWLAILACLMGCTQPAFANAPTIRDLSSSSKNFADPNPPELMADMENCHHSHGSSPASHNDGKPASNGAVSCCPLEITVAPKWNSAALKIVILQALLPPSDFHPVVTRLSRFAEPAAAQWHSGRDTLLETHLLRI